MTAARLQVQQELAVKMYLVSLGVGILVGVIYSILNVRSPAPPLVALVGLLGILAGEQVIPLGKQLLSGSTIPDAWRQADCGEHIFRPLPGSAADQDSADLEKKRS